jgi:23S rRNA (guanine745-N1)-methyltransferase
MLRCPVCQSDLVRQDRVYRCSHGHTFDIAKEGYVNLTVGHSVKRHGDDAAMVNARRIFLSLGHYAPLKAAVLDVLASLKVTSLVDLGCGEGDYTRSLAEAGYDVMGIDLSKSAIKRAAKGSQATFILANLTDTPLTDHSADAVLSIFSPFDALEVCRISRGWFVAVRPCPDHLVELKTLLYPVVRPNPNPSTTLQGMTHHGRRELVFDLSLDQKALNALLDMTPYVHTSPQAGIDKVRACPSLTVRAAFAVDVFACCTPTGNSL